MGYELTLRPRDGELDEEAFVELFNDRPHYRFPDEDPSVAAYFNPSTEIYFHFRWTEPSDDEPTGALAFSINFFRPPTFALEAETELAEITELLDLRVADPQVDGIAGETYDGDQFLRGWEHGNEQAYEAVRSHDPAPTLFHLPWATLEQIWKWNYLHADTAEENGGHYDAALIGFAKLSGKLVTVAKLDLDRAALLPRVDHVYIKRGERGTFASWDEVETALALTPGDSIEDPWPYWAVTRSESEVLDRLLNAKRPIVPIDSLDVQDVHASEDVVHERR